jgi:hypothetical protein
VLGVVHEVANERRSNKSGTAGNENGFGRHGFSLLGWDLSTGAGYDSNLYQASRPRQKEPALLHSARKGRYASSAACESEQLENECSDA